MKWITRLVTGLTCGILALASQPGRAEVAVGDPVPTLKLPGSDGKDYDFADFKGKQAVVIAWYPKAFTGG